MSPAAFSLEVLKLNNNGLGAGGKAGFAVMFECDPLNLLGSYISLVSRLSPSVCPNVSLDRRSLEGD